MTARAATPKITPDDLLVMPDADAYELIDGRLRKKDVSFESSNLAMRIGAILDAFIEPQNLGSLGGPDSSYRCFPDDPDKVRRPDVAFVSRARMPDDLYFAPGHTPVCPELVVEVISPNDGADDVDRKVQDWLEAGAVVVWTVHPAVRVLRSHQMGRPIQVFGVGDVVTVEEMLPGFQMSVARIFRGR